MLEKLKTFLNQFNFSFECPFCKAQSKTNIINKTVIAEKDHDGRKVVPR